MINQLLKLFCQYTVAATYNFFHNRLILLLFSRQIDAMSRKHSKKSQSLFPRAQSVLNPCLFRPKVPNPNISVAFMCDKENLQILTFKNLKPENDNFA